MQLKKNLIFVNQGQNTQIIFQNKNFCFVLVWKCERDKSVSFMVRSKLDTIEIYNSLTTGQYYAKTYLCWRNNRETLQQ